RNGAKDDEQYAYEKRVGERPCERATVSDMQLFKAPVESLADAPNKVAASRGGAAFGVTGSALIEFDFGGHQVSDERWHESVRQNVRGQHREHHGHRERRKQ